MSDFNSTHFTNPTSFILVGIPGLEAAHIWISIPFCGIYTIAVLGNFIILCIVRMETSLHAPMYYFLCMLAVVHLVLPRSTLPKMLSIFWLNSREIDFSVCLLHLYFFYSFTVMEYGILVPLALDHYVAICDPLGHSTILTNPAVVKISLAVLLWGGLLILPHSFLAKKWPYCRTNVIAHPYCKHLSVVNLVCADICISSYYSLFVTFLVTFIMFSYTQILKAIFALPTKEARVMIFGTCGSHLCLILALYVPALFSFLTHQFGYNVPLYFQIITANIYLLVPSMLNPIIYGVRTKEIQNKLFKLFTH